MTTIAEKDRPTIRDVLTRELIADVELLLFTRGRSNQVLSDEHGGQSCDETRELLEELVALSDHLHLTSLDVATHPSAASSYNVTAVPTVIVRRRLTQTRSSDAALGDTAVSSGATSTDTTSATNSVPGSPDAPRANVRFLGLPGGYEFSTLLADIVDLSKGRTDLSPTALDVVRGIAAPVHIQVFVTPACPYCPRVARVAHQMAMQNPLIVSDVIDANEFQVLSERYRVRSVPKTVINDRIEFQGFLPEGKMLEALLKAVSHDA
jgi:thiol-disulfide isomerase/thioredoxin